jgi:hypothetical protein
MSSDVIDDASSSIRTPSASSLAAANMKTVLTTWNILRK